MKRYGVYVEGLNESLIHKICDTHEEAEELKHTLEAQLLGAKVKVVDWEDHEKGAK